MLKILLMTLAVNAAIPKNDEFYIFSYNTSNKLRIGVYANDEYEALKKAAKQCFHDLDARFERESEALKIIDICANPIKTVRLK